MYLMEWILWLSVIKSDAWLQEQADENPNDLASKPLEPVYEDLLVAEYARLRAARSDHAESRGPVYACDNTILEMRCGGMEERRGFITLISAFFSLPTIAGIDLMWLSFSLYEEQPWGYADTILMIGLLIGSLGAPYIYFKYLFRFTRLESLTSRHLLIRFNRITRQVYLHRPPSCGGIAVLPWDDIHHDTVPGVNLVVGWYPPYSPLPFPNMAFVGKKSVSEFEMKAEWEYIRRYMDEGGLDAVTPPRLSSHLPLPWPAFAAQFEALGPYLRHSGPLTWLGMLLISPALVIIGLAHWLSLLLCWRPRWPKIIREAGLPGKPTPPLSTIDDYPPDVRAALLENAHRWVVRPGSPPARPKRFNTRLRWREQKKP
ncbi:hypothetical protein N8H69_09485 [Achromobacter spanius]|uniref:hypothetical protein n=1 Tax=Achromobacter spanius TaxID=217203 RepID=UPI002226ADF8|nr:hypothetical protein [Achromobacter spanius]MCW3152763.1 hypothetical protein [Achromobacter spanius]